MNCAIPYKSLFEYRSAFDPTESKLLGFASFKPGWHYGDGIAFPHQAIDDAILINRQIFFKNFKRTNAFPGPDGEIQVTVYHDDHYFQFERELSGAWNITHEKNDVQLEFLPNQSCSDVVNYVNSLAWKISPQICDTSAVYTGLIGTMIESGSTAWPLSDEETECQLFKRTVPLTPAPQSVHIYRSGIPWSENPLFIGNLNNQRSFQPMP